MNITEFLSKIGFKSHGSVVNSWDAFSPTGTVLMQLWQAPGQRVSDHAVPGAYLRVRCLDAEHHARNAKRQAVGYGGRFRAIEALKVGTKGYAALSSPPSDLHGAGEWAKHADLDRVYPVLAVEEAGNGDIFAILGTPISANDMK